MPLIEHFVMYIPDKMQAMRICTCKSVSKIIALKYMIYEGDYITANKYAFEASNKNVIQ